MNEHNRLAKISSEEGSEVLWALVESGWTLYTAVARQCAVIRDSSVCARRFVARAYGRITATATAGTAMAVTERCASSCVPVNRLPRAPPMQLKLV